MLAEKVARMILGLTVGAWMARHLGPEAYGELAYTLAFIAFFQAGAALGLDGILSRELAQARRPDGALLGTALSLRLLAAVGGWGVAVAVSFIADGGAHGQTVLVAIVGAVLVFQPAEFIELWFLSQGAARRGAQVRLLANVLGYGFKVVLILAGASVGAFAMAFVLDAVMVAVILWIAYRSRPTQHRWTFQVPLALELLGESWPLMIGGISVMVYMRVDQMMVRNMLGTEQLGIYAAVLPLATLWTVIPMTLNASLAPVVARKKTESEAAYQHLMGVIFRAYGALGWVLSGFSAVAAYWLIPTLFGPAYMDGVAPVMLYGLCNLFITLGTAQSLWVLNERRPRITLYKALLGAIACVMLNLLLIPRGGLMGAALSAVLAQCISAVACNLLLAPNVFKHQMRSLLLLPHRSIST
jgi:O-antigen/teichoic acid export membrane protein